jgi:hypothetical protein
MKFENVEDLFQFFANEYCIPKSIILIIAPGDKVLFFKELFDFLNSEIIFVDTIYYQGIDIIVDLDNLPFESYSFNLVISLKNSKDLLRVCKGDILVKEEIINAKENYLVKSGIFSVI